jgi:putative exosortase-associated protein (TIGR04073 family)
MVNYKVGRVVRIMQTKLILTSVFIALFIVSWSGIGFADETAQTSTTASTEKTYTSGDKLYRGTMNMITSPLEIPSEIHGTTHDKSLLAGWTLGLFKGVKEGLFRLGTGAIDFVTFPFSYPDKEYAPLMKPEYVWDKPGLKYV